MFLFHSFCRAVYNFERLLSICQAFLWITLPSLYIVAAQTSNSSGNNLYIVSVYGNHYASSTIIDIKGESTEPVILVLANYYPVTWRVMYNGLTVKKIILVSLKRIGSLIVSSKNKICPSWNVVPFYLVP